MKALFQDFIIMKKRLDVYRVSVKRLH